MKSEHRHELAENDLEVFINKIRARFAEAMELHGNRIMLWSSAVLLLIAAFVFYQNNSGSANAEGWAALTGAQNAEDLASVADSYKETPVGQWAKLRVGEQYMQSGLTLMFTDREAGKADLEEAQNAFNELLNNSKTSDVIRERALYGLASVLETTSGADLKPAIETYQKLLSNFPDTAYKVVVEQRIKDLENKSTQEFYAWFAEQNPEPKDIELPTDLQSQFPGLNFPPITPEGKPGEKTPQEEMPAKEAGKEVPSKDAAKPGPKLSVPTAPALGKDKKTETPKKPEAKKKPATEKPKTEKPKTEKPKTEKPAAKKPADTPPKTEKKKPAPVKKEEAKAEEKKPETPQPKTQKPESGSK